MIARGILVAWLTAVWIALWGDVTVQNAVAGAIVAVAVVVVFPLERAFKPRVRPVALARLAVVFTWRLIVASAVVAWEVVTPRNQINEGIVAVPVVAQTDFVMALIANAISLTPGTLTIEVDRDGGRLFVHVLHLNDVETIRHDVRTLEELVIKAFGP